MSYLGEDEERNRANVPYHEDDFEELVLVGWVGEIAHIWCIPMWVLVEREYARTAANPCGGQQSITVHIKEDGVNVGDVPAHRVVQLPRFAAQSLLL